jgi:TolB-like protein
VRDLVEPSQDALMAGRTLLADSILEGYMQRQGDRLRVSTRLLDVASGRQLWNGHFDEPFTDIFTVQDAIADRVANALAPQLTPAERRRLHHRHTEDAEAYQLYVNGCFTGAG